MTELNDCEIAALGEALDDEYHAYSIYDQVVADFGEVRPFINIRGAEARHIDALLDLFGRYNLRPEIANGALYERLMGSTTRPDLLAVFANLREASQERHLPAFQRCLDRSPHPDARNLA